jgi:hypothetical protein
METEVNRSAVATDVRATAVAVAAKTPAAHLYRLGFLGPTMWPRVALVPPLRDPGVPSPSRPSLRFLIEQSDPATSRRDFCPFARQPIGAHIPPVLFNI